MSRIMEPTPTVGKAPSHSPPDMQYAPGISMARGLGWFSIGLGLAEVLAPRAMSQLTGVRQEGLLQVFGVREIITGIGILASDRPVGWMAARVAGDALDLGALAENLCGADDERRGPLLASSMAVLGVAALDAGCAAALGAAAALEG